MRDVSRYCFESLQNVGGIKKNLNRVMLAPDLISEKPSGTCRYRMSVSVDIGLANRFSELPVLSVSSLAVTSFAVNGSVSEVDEEREAVESASDSSSVELLSLSPYKE